MRNPLLKLCERPMVSTSQTSVTGSRSLSSLGRGSGAARKAARRVIPINRTAASAQALPALRPTTSGRYASMDFRMNFSRSIWSGMTAAWLSTSRTKARLGSLDFTNGSQPAPAFLSKHS